MLSIETMCPSGSVVHMEATVFRGLEARSLSVTCRPDTPKTDNVQVAGLVELQGLECQVENGRESRARHSCYGPVVCILP